MPTIEANAPPPAVPVDALKAYLRIGCGDEDALLAGLIRGATELCEAFIGQWLIARAGTEILPATSGWARLGAAPVRAITGIEGLPAAGEAFALAVDAYRLDIDADATGWISVADAGGAKRVRVAFVAGIAEDANGVPEAIRQGIVRLAADHYAQRGVDAPPPAAVTALWRPWRRMRLR